MLLGPEPKGCDQNLISLILFVLVLLFLYWLCCQMAFPLLVVKWLPSFQPYIFLKFKSAYVFGDCFYKSP